MNTLIIISLIILSWAIGKYFFEKINVKLDFLVEEFVFSSTLGVGVLGLGLCTLVGIPIMIFVSNPPKRKKHKICIGSG
tara:strand:+ start:844 stop:1080 length:237 start_codon:yes stop_codon:yes gene_type:complete